MVKLKSWKCFSVVMAVVLVLGVAAIAFPSATARAQEATWDLQTINEDDAVCTSIALDSHGYPHIAYCTGGLFSVHYSSWTGTSWVTETVADVPALVVSLALDSQDNPHIAYSTAPPLCLHYASKVGGAWTIQTADPCNVSDCSLAMDSQNRPHICYIASNYVTVPGPLKYAYLTDTGWENGFVGCAIATSCSLALDGGDLPHIGFTTGGEDSVHYAHLVDSAWAFETVHECPAIAVSIALDSHGSPHIAYCTGASDSLLYASRIGADTWTTQTVDPANASDCSLAMDSQDNPHISYYVGIVSGGLGAGGEEEPAEQGIVASITVTDILKYAAWTGSAWDIQVVDQETAQIGFGGFGPSVFKWCSLALDDDDLPNISYGNMVSFLLDSLHYAHLVMPEMPELPTKPKYSPPMPNTNLYIYQTNMSIQFVSVNPQQAIANQPVTITTNVVNNGDAAGNYNVDLKINGQVEESRMVSVGPMASQPVKFTVTRDQPGTYTVDIVDKSSSFTILGDSAAGGTSGKNTTGLMILVLIGVLVVATVVVLLVRRA